MEQDKIYNEISTLPPEAQRQVIDFIAFLRERYKRSKNTKQTRQPNLFNEPFLGIWKDRKDMKDSGAWLRNTRRTEWSDAH